MTKLLLCFILIGLAVSCGDGFQDKQSRKEQEQEPQRGSSSQIIEEYMGLVNQHRISLGLVPLNYHLVIQEIADSHSKAMALGTRPFSHGGMRIRCQRIRNRLDATRTCGEIIAYGHKTSQALFKGWMNSREHRKQIDKAEYTFTGIGKAQDKDGKTYWTQLFVKM